MLGMSERSFRRYRRRYEDDGLDGLFGRLDKASARRVPADRIEWVLEQYRSRYGLDGQALPRPSLRPPWLRLELHLDQDHLAARRRCCVGTGAHALTGASGEQERIDGVLRQGDAQQPLHRPWQPLLPHPRGRRQGRQGSTHPGRPRPPSARHRDIAAYSPEARGRSERFGTLQDASSSGVGGDRSKPPTASSQTPTCPTTIAASPELEGAFVPLEARSTTSSAPRPHGRPRQHRALRKARPPDPRHPSQTPLRRPGSGSTSIQTRPLPRAPMPQPLHRQRRAHRNPNPRGRVASVKWTAAPRLTTSLQVRRAGRHLSRTSTSRLWSTSPVTSDIGLNGRTAFSGRGRAGAAREGYADRSGEPTRWLLFDAVVPDQPLVGHSAGERVSLVAGDVADGETVRALIAGDSLSVFHRFGGERRR